MHDTVRFTEFNGTGCRQSSLQPMKFKIAPESILFDYSPR